MASIAYDVAFTERAAALLREIRDGNARKAIGSKVDDLKTDAELRGKPLQDELRDYRSMPAAGRYRVIYRVYPPVPVTDPAAPPPVGKVYVVCVGIRKDGSKSDVYALASKMLSRGELNPE